MARILVVDDEPDVLLRTRMVLESAGHETFLAADAERALERLAVDGIDLVVLDVCMPIRDGWSVLRAAQAGPLPVPVVILSGRAEAGHIEYARSLGAVAYVPKPYAPADLTAAVVGALGG
jgi:CheY-like chemotaxis protein